MREIIPFIAFMKEVYFIFNINISNPEVFCKVFEDNKTCLAVAESYKFSPRTKHITINYINLPSFVKNNMIWICYIDTR